MNIDEDQMMEAASALIGMAREVEAHEKAPISNVKMYVDIRMNNGQTETWRIIVSREARDGVVIN